jgi:hypothetical protein
MTPRHRQKFHFKIRKLRIGEVSLSGMAQIMRGEQDSKPGYLSLKAMLPPTYK